MRPEQQTNNMFRFQNPEYFYLMGILPAMVLIYIYGARGVPTAAATFSATKSWWKE